MLLQKISKIGQNDAVQWTCLIAFKRPMWSNLNVTNILIKLFFFLLYVSAIVPSTCIIEPKENGLSLGLFLSEVISVPKCQSTFLLCLEKWRYWPFWLLVYISSVQSAKKSAPKPLTTGQQWGTFLCSFGNETLFSSAFFQHFLPFSFIKTRCQKSGKFSGNMYQEY